MERGAEIRKPSCRIDQSEEKEFRGKPRKSTKVS